MPRQTATTAAPTTPPQTAGASGQGAHSERRPAPRWLHGLGLAVAALACLAVFGLYTDPEFMVQMADQVWACF